MANRPLHPLLQYLRRLRTVGADEGARNDAELLHGFVNQNDEDAFATLVQRYGAMVWGLCVRRLGETPEAEDAFQATFLVLVRKASSLHGSQLLGPWLYEVACRTTLKLSGQRARRAARETPLPEQLAEEGPEAMESDLRSILDEEIHRLPTKYRLPVLLCYLQGLSCEEAARRLGCPKGTIFSRLSRARDLLRHRLLRRGVGVSAGVLAVVFAESAALRASVPATLFELSVRTSLVFAAGTAGQSLSAPLAALVEGVVRSMFLSKVKLALIVVLALGLAGTGAGFLVRPDAAEQPQNNSATKAKAAPPRVVDRTKTKPKAPPKKTGPIAPDAAVQNQRLLEWREILLETIRFEGIDDRESKLIEVLDLLSKRYRVSFLINELAFSEAGLREIDQFRAASRPIPAMTTSLRTLLQFILRRIAEEQGVEAVFLVRTDHIEITTAEFCRLELGLRSKEPLYASMLPLVWDAYEEMPLAQILARLAETSGYNVVGDPKAKERLQTKITAQLNNVPIGTAVRLVANMAGLTMVRLDNVFYVTTTENAKNLRKEQARVDEERSGMAGTQPATGKHAK